MNDNTPPITAETLRQEARFICQNFTAPLFRDPTVYEVEAAVAGLRRGIILAGGKIEASLD